MEVVIIIDGDAPADVDLFADLRALMARDLEIALPLVGEAIDNSLRALYAVMEPYPPETIANSPQNPTGRWYERHYGPRWIRKTAGGDVSLITSRKRANVFEGAGLIGGSPTSEQLQLRWNLEKAQAQGDVIEGALENPASYSLVVQGPLEGEPGRAQSEVMANIGWLSIDEGIGAVADTVDAIWSDLLGKLTDKLAE